MKVYTSALTLTMKVRVNFLHVGNTHADCDQFFSRISPYITKHGAKHLQGKLLLLLYIIYIIIKYYYNL